LESLFLIVIYFSHDLEFLASLNMKISDIRHIELLDIFKRMQRKVSNFLILKRAKEELIQINDRDNEIND
jgi:hypothetical protein